MPTKSLLDSVWVKILLVMIPCTVTVVGVMISLWADVRDMKSQRMLITDGRLVRLETRQDELQRQVDENKAAIKALWQRRSRSEQPTER